MRPLAAAVLASGLFAIPLFAADPKPDYARGRKQLDAYFKHQVKLIEAACLTDLTTKEAWEQKRPELRRQFLEMMGLWPLPAKTDLKVTITGTVEGDGFTVQKLHFQSMPGLYVTANLYLPKESGGRKPPESGRFPTILYVCGHGNVLEGGVSFGSKVAYQYHPAWFAKHGYVCLILDTNELGEIRGDHHGTYSRGLWWWHARGYTPAGVELWNAMRALDYLETRPEVDAKRFGITGRSGGGATSWWVAAADDRVQAIVPVAGITDLYSHLCSAPSERLRDGVIAGHCDCMYQVNAYRWDFAQVVALCAPRPLLLGNSDADDIFPVPGYRSIADKVRKVYSLYGAEEKFQLLETSGPHKDTPELHLGINRWMNRWLKDEPKAEVVPDLEKRLKPSQLRVFEKLPEPRLNETIHDTFVPTAKEELPTDAAAWAKQKAVLIESLKTKVFAGWTKEPTPLRPKVEVDVTHEGVRLRAIDFTSETAVPLRMWVMTSPKVETPAEVIVSVLDEPGWERWCGDLGPAFAEALQLPAKPKRNDAQFAQNRTAMERNMWAYAAVAPRGIGPTKWAEPGSKDDVQIRRRFPLIGQTLDGQRVWDVRRAIHALRVLPDSTGPKLTLQGQGDAAGVALYAALFEPTVSALDAWNLPLSHHSGPTFLNVLKYLDTPQAVALAAPRKVTLHVKREADREAWAWPLRVAKAAGDGSVIVKVEGE